MKKYTYRIALIRGSRQLNEYVIFRPNKTIFCVVCGEDAAKKIRDFMNKEFIK